MNKSFILGYDKNGDDRVEKQTIHCSVHNCDFCNEQENHCKLDEIKVCNCNPASEKEATMCDSFKERENG